MKEHVEWMGFAVAERPRVRVMTMRRRWLTGRLVCEKRDYERVGCAWLPLDTRCMSVGTRYALRLTRELHRAADDICVIAEELGDPPSIATPEDWAELGRNTTGDAAESFRTALDGARRLTAKEEPWKP